MKIRPTCMGIALALSAASLTTPLPSFGQAASQMPAQARDGTHDFDWEIGNWTTQLRYLAEPLTGSTRWVEYRGTSDVRPLLGGRANVVELSVEGSAGRIEGVSLRLYNPKARQWTLNFASVRNGLLTPPVTGAFDAKGKGTFYGTDTVNERMILVRFVISDVTPNSARFEQAFSADGGTTWETNWIAVDTRR
ncbi:hypothetical protein PIB19_06575 [Sphingomonas sp. 7/4-4]|uniref:hypothetical protein n=1 Tax=Sphingomonas sp. 7/4-4 TaxID=3018446 RepID=UPI0022F3B286|nr:hypothetical protein [Sphingomonas sp. 7/4-4]WBY09035.1 hypothetical protein PIB19_06575 [Sphingomonas sp. 7/4-4]